MTGHYLRKNESTRTPGNLVFVDTESTPTVAKDGRTVHRFRLGAACFVRLRKGRAVREEWYNFDEPHHFWDWLIDRSESHRPTWVFAHKATFDLTMLNFWQLLGDYEFTWQAPPRKGGGPKKGKDNRPERRGFAVLEGPPTLIKCFDRKGQVYVFCDTLNYWKCTLQELGDSIGCPKWEMPAFEADDDAWLNYCQNDVEIIRKAILGLMQRTQKDDLGNWKGTAPGLAYNCYRHRFMEKKILIDQNPVASAISRACYFGGQVRVGFQGLVMSAGNVDYAKAKAYHPLDYPVDRSKVYKLDVRSAYPWAMQHRPHPYHLEGIERKLTPRMLWDLTGHWWAAAIVGIQSDTVAYPRRSEGRTDYVTGAFYTGLCGDELQEALSRGHVKEVKIAAIYRQAYLFSNYVAYWYAEKLAAEVKGDNSRRSHAKLMLNALYGKFGAKSAKWVDRFDVPAPKEYGAFGQYDQADGKFKLFRSVGWLSQERVEVGEHSEALPAISASITAAVRVYMRRLWAIAGDKGVYYQDTDSLHCSESGYERLCWEEVDWSDAPGALRVEQEADSAWYRGARNYQFGGLEVIAGLRADYVTRSPGELEHEVGKGLQELISDRPDGTWATHRERFRVSESLRVGRVGADGWVSPNAIHSGALPLEIAGNALFQNFNLDVAARDGVGAGQIAQPLADAVSDAVDADANPLQGLARRRKDDGAAEEETTDDFHG
jgi:hypothetical protein